MRLPPFPPEKKPPERASPAGTAGCGNDTVLRPCPATTRAERQIRGTAAHRALPPPSFPYWGKARSAERPSAPACAGLPRNAACTKEPRCPSAPSPAPTRAHRDAISPEGKLHNAPPSFPSLRFPLLPLLLPPPCARLVLSPPLHARNPHAEGRRAVFLPPLPPFPSVFPLLLLFSAAFSPSPPLQLSPSPGHGRFRPLPTPAAGAEAPPCLCKCRIYS